MRKKTNYILNSLIAGSVYFFSYFVFAQEEFEMPRLYPHCSTQYQLEFPENFNTSYFWNKDCSVLYLIPPVGRLKIANPALTAKVRLCPTVNSQIETLNLLNEEYNKLNKKYISLPPGSPERKIYAEELATLKSLFPQLDSDLYNQRALTAQLSFSSGVLPELINKIRELNPVLNSLDINIQQAPFVKSYLSFNAVLPSSAEPSLDNPVLESNVMGILSQASENSNDRDDITFNGSSDGYVVLNLNGACPILNGNFNEPKSLTLDRSLIRNYLVATQTMVVPFQTSFGYQAKFEIKKISKNIFEKLGKKTQFSAQEILNQFTSGEYASLFSIVSWTQEDANGKLSTVSNIDLSSENIQKIKKAIFDEYLLTRPKVFGLNQAAYFVFS